MTSFGVLCLMGDEQQALVTVDAESAEAARERVLLSKSLFYGPGDGAGEWLMNKQPETTIINVGEVRPLAEWDDGDASAH